MLGGLMTRSQGWLTMTRMPDPSFLGGVDTEKLGRQLPMSIGGLPVIEKRSAQGFNLTVKTAPPLHLINPHDLGVLAP